MSEDPLTALRHKWRGLSFSKINYTRPIIAPEHFFGFAGEESLVYYDNETYCPFDLDTLDWAPVDPRTPQEIPVPQVHDIICGEIIPDAKNPRFAKWFVPDTKFELLVELTKHGLKSFDIDSLQQRPYSYISHPCEIIAFLFLCNDVEGLIDRLTGEAAARFGIFRVFDQDDRLIHMLSHHYYPKWWEEYLDITSGRPVKRHHKQCPACLSEQQDPTARVNGAYC